MLSENWIRNKDNKEGGKIQKGKGTMKRREKTDNGKGGNIFYSGVFST